MRLSVAPFRFFRWQNLLPAWLAFVPWLSVALASTASPIERSFDIPPDSAESALRAFTAQSGRELLFSTHTAREVRTNPVHGRFTAEKALQRLLAGTVLTVANDDGSGVLRVIRRSTANSRPGSLLPRRLIFRRPPPPGSPDNDESQPIRLSPFEVQTSLDRGYIATSTLAGSRLNTSLLDAPASISVFTRDFIDDIGATDVNQALEYSLNGGPNLTDSTGNQITTNDLLIQFRGFTGASLGRNYFTWALSSDSYNIERLDFSRGPNSILFGIGGPGGILNTSTKRARIGSTSHQVRARIASFHEARGEIDANSTLLPGRLAARVNLLYQDRGDWREFVGATRTGAALAVTWRPFRQTEIRFDGEYGDVNQVVAQPWPAQERFQAWTDAGSVIALRHGDAAPGTLSNISRQFVYDPESGLGPISWFGSRLSNGSMTAPSLGNNTAAITDERILPRRSAVTGPGFRGDYYFYNYAVFAEQRLGDLAVEAAFNRQSEQREQYRPQVFNDVALRVDVNATLPNGEPNPNAGRYYTDGQLQIDTRDHIRDDYRLTSSYTLDLRSGHHLLGEHTITGLLARRDGWNRNDSVNEVNLTPSASAGYPADLTDASNLIRRRTYLDFDSSDPARHGLHDPRLHPIDAAGVRAGLARTRDASSHDLSRIDSRMVAFHSKFLESRLMFTGGLRNDRQRAWGSTADLNDSGSNQDDRDPVTRTYPRRKRNAAYSYSSGNTRTYGAVFHFTPWLSFFHNNANNFIPQAERDIDGAPLGNRTGQGQDTGVRLRLLEGRINPSLVYYRTDEINTSVGRDNAFINAIDTIWQTLGSTDRLAEQGSRDSQDTRGRGWEFDLTANPVSGWRLSANVSRTEQTLANIQPRGGRYIAANRSFWTSEADRRALVTTAGVPTVDPLTGRPTTIGTVIRLIDDLYAGFRQAEGQSRRQLRKYNANLFTTYDLGAGAGWLARTRVGGGVNYRGKAVVGYDSSRGNAPLYGSDYFLLNIMLSRSFKLSSSLRLRLQLNIDNLLDETQPIISDADQNQIFRVILKAPRRWSLSSSVSF